LQEAWLPASAIGERSFPAPVAMLQPCYLQDKIAHESTNKQHTAMCLQEAHSIICYNDEIQEGNGRQQVEFKCVPRDSHVAKLAFTTHPHKHWLGI
jgi:hypothetical protein